MTVAAVATAGLSDCSLIGQGIVGIVWPTGFSPVLAGCMSAGEAAHTDYFKTTVARAIVNGINMTNVARTSSISSQLSHITCFGATRAELSPIYMSLEL